MREVVSWRSNADRHSIRDLAANHRSIPLAQMAKNRDCLELGGMNYKVFLAVSYLARGLWMRWFCGWLKRRARASQGTDIMEIVRPDDLGISPTWV